ncbi:hypothetical protein GF345_04480 [Candidatus Woesearchaeota archaeon]|nr:hypothetical protein [Candidatus Woesearchaeota archaeon]
MGDMMENNDAYILEALKEAEKAAERGNYGIGAVVVLEDKIISRAGNEVISRGIVPWAHAEFLALDNLKGSEFDDMFQYKSMALYSTLAPCPMCWGRMIVSGLREVVYGADDDPATQDYGKSIPEIFREHAPSIRRIEGDIGQRCVEIFLATKDDVDKYFFRQNED